MISDITARLKSALADRYTIERELGAGGMATVYAARDLRHDRQVALKVLKPDVAATLGAERFLLEIKVAARLSHPHILPLHDSGRAAEGQGGQEFLFYVMPVVEGESLRSRINREGQLGVEATCELAKEIGGALDYAHSQGVIHRDIKPENILFHHGIPMVADFGIALAVKEAGGERLTETGISVGTPQYMSPEQVSGDRQLDPRSDVYALGCVLYEALVGEPPFTGPSAMAVMARQVTDPVRPIATVRPDVPATLVSAVTRALAKVPADRFDSAGHLAIALATPEPAPAPERVPTAAKQGPAPRRTIAVLPFANMSADPENEYFSDGITDDVMSQLSKVGELKVISRTSTSRFRDTELSLREIGEQLNADVILEGTVRKAGSRVRIVAQLIDATNDTHVWNDTYDRMLTDVFEIQSEVAISIAEALEAELSPKERREIFKKPTDDLEAYDLYLLGRHHCNKRAADDLRSAITYFEQAIERDAGYADAYAGLAEVYVFAGIGYMPMPSAEAFARAKEMALRAIQIDPARATAHAMLGFTALTCDGDVATAERSLSHAQELDSNYVQTYQWLGWCRTCVGDYFGGSEAWERALELDPLSAVITAESGWPFIYTGLYELALERFQRALELEPDLAIAHFCVGWALDNLGRYEEAIVAFEKSGELPGSAPFWKAFLASAYSKVGRRDRAETILNELCEHAEQHGGLGVSVAVVAEALGHGDLALDSLERAYSSRDDMPLYAIQITEFLPFASLRGHPRFQAIVDGLGLSPHDIEGERKRFLERERAREAVERAEPEAPVAPSASEPEQAVHDEVEEQKKHRPEQSQNSIAVLPFANMSTDPENEYFSDGITDEIINLLSKIPDLRVTARTSAFAFKGATHDIREIADKLSVGSILEGSVRRSGNQLRVAVQLVDVGTGSTTWSDRFDREMADVFAIQDEIASAIAHSLSPSFFSSDKSAEKIAPANLEAYDAYLKGRFYWAQGSFSGVQKSIPNFERAIELDPGFAGAYAGLALTYSFQMLMMLVPRQDLLTKLREAITNALSRDDTQADAHAAFGYLKMVADWDWAGAEAEFKRAIEVNPNSATAYHQYGVLLSNLGFADRAIETSKRAVELDPLYAGAVQTLGYSYMAAGDFEKGVEYQLKTLELEPANFGANAMLPVMYSALGDHQKALVVANNAVATLGKHPFLLSHLGFVHARAGRRAEALEVIDELKLMSTNEYVSASCFAHIHLGLGEVEETLDWLEKSFVEKSPLLMILPHWYEWDAYRNNPRFQRIYKAIGFDKHAAPRAPVGEAEPTDVEKSIAVLPFINLSPDPDQEYFSDGLTEEVISDLSKLKSLRVISRSSAMTFKGSDKKIPEIAKELNVRYALEGSVRKAGNSLRVTAQLIDAVDDAHLWSEKYTGTLDDVFDMQEQVSRSIVEALDVELSGHESEVLAERPIPNLVAYEHYLRARSEIYGFDKESLERASEHLNQGLAIVGENALLLRGLGLVHFQMLNTGSSEDESHIEELDRCADRIKNLDPADPGGFLLSGLANGLRATGRQAVLDLYKSYLRDSSDPDTLTFLGVTMLSTGQPERSREILDELIRIDPMVWISNLLVGYTAFFQGRFDDMLPPLRRGLELGPDVPVNLWCGVRLFASVGLKDDALAASERLQELHGETPFAESARIFVAALERRTEDIVEPSDELRAWATRDGEWGQFLVDAYALAGLEGKALEWLEICTNAGFMNLSFLTEHDPFLESVRGSSRFKEIIERVEHELEEFEKRIAAVAGS